MKTTLIRTSICACGYPAVDTPLGTEYEIDPDRVADFSWRCGGCGEWQHIVGVFVLPRYQGNRPGFMPLQLFDLSLETVKKEEA